MATLTYNTFTGLVTLTSPSLSRPLIAHAESGASNFPWDSGTRQVGAHGAAGHVCGGPIPPGRWRVGMPGSRHPDGGTLRPDWIPIGPVPNRTHIYIHCGQRTEGCINVPIFEREIYDRIRVAIVSDVINRIDSWITVGGGDVA